LQAEIDAVEAAPTPAAVLGLTDLIKPPTDGRLTGLTRKEQLR
jgi:hypothetical protein